MPKTTIYTTIACGYCMRAKQLLEEKQIPFKEIDVSYNGEGRRAMMETAGGRMTFPQIFLEDRLSGDGGNSTSSSVWKGLIHC